jgi:hypothetical protein
VCGIVVAVLALSTLDKLSGDPKPRVSRVSCTSHANCSGENPGKMITCTRGILVFATIFVAYLGQTVFLELRERALHKPVAAVDSDVFAVSANSQIDLARAS